jgi:hypothetical protein
MYLEGLQADLDDWLREYNLTRTHSGKYCYGKTPMQTFLDSAHLAREKMLDSFPNAAPEPERSPAQRSAGGGAVAVRLLESNQLCQIKSELLQSSVSPVLFSPPACCWQASLTIAGRAGAPGFGA